MSPAPELTTWFADADKETAERVVHFLEDVGLEVTRWNVSHRKGDGRRLPVLTGASSWHSAVQSMR